MDVKLLLECRPQNLRQVVKIDLGFIQEEEAPPLWGRSLIYCLLTILDLPPLNLPPAMINSIIRYHSIKDRFEITGLWNDPLTLFHYSTSDNLPFNPRNQASIVPWIFTSNRNSLQFEILVEPTVRNCENTIQFPSFFWKLKSRLVLLVTRDTKDE